MGLPERGRGCSDPCPCPCPCTHWCTQAGGRWPTSTNTGGRRAQVTPTRRTSTDIYGRTAFSYEITADRLAVRVVGAETASAIPNAHSKG